MPQCPACGTELVSDFGMVTCTNCHAISVIDLDGNVQLDSGGEPQATPELAPIEPEQSPEIFTIETPAPSEPMPLPDVGADGLQSSDLSADILSEISEFANSDLSQGKDGLLVFDLIVSGIDSRELREAVRDSITDQRFLWDVKEIMTGIQDGKLVLKGLNPVKATILVNRLKGLSLDIKWKQHSIIS